MSSRNCSRTSFTIVLIARLLAALDHDFVVNRVAGKGKTRGPNAQPDSRRPLAAPFDRFVRSLLDFDRHAKAFADAEVLARSRAIEDARIFKGSVSRRPALA